MALPAFFFYLSLFSAAVYCCITSATVSENNNVNKSGAHASINKLIVADDTHSTCRGGCTWSTGSMFQALGVGGLPLKGVLK